jgi:type IV pilus assembly protein PilB
MNSTNQRAPMPPENPDRPHSSKIVGDLLLKSGLVDSAGLARALEVQRREQVSLGNALARLNLADEEAVAAAIARGLHLDYLGAETPATAPEVLGLLASEFCCNRLVIPLRLKGNSLSLVMADPLAYHTVQDVEFLTGKRVTPVVASQTSVQRFLEQFYRPELELPHTYEMLEGVIPEGEVEVHPEEDDELVDSAKLAQDTKQPPVVKLVNLILSNAAKEGASDIHFERYEHYVQVRFRVDGLLHDVLRIPKALQDATISRLKIEAGMDIADRRRPQDGRSRLRFEGKVINLRVSTLPTNFGEKVVIRLLDSSKAAIPMESLNLTPENLRILQGLLVRPRGMILVTGPTGSGKTTTLYTSLNWVKSPTKNIITVEDPIEYQITGINQVQINPRAGVTFASGLRSILRQDPNVILVGEIRDRETAEIALEAAQTGHLLLSTLHTNDATATITRMLDLGIEPFLIASSVIGIVAQRLVRRNCPACSEPQAPSAATIEMMGKSGLLPADDKWLAGRGCEQCKQSGFKGRLAIHEILQVNDEIRLLISNRATELVIRNAARRGGMRTMMEDGIAKGAAGLAPLEEIVRMVAKDESPLEPPEAPPPPLPAITVMTDGKEIVEAPKLSAPPETPPAAPPSPKHRVLVVEDSATVATVVKYFLEIEGFEVLLAEGGRAGLAIARRERPHVIVTDLNMPDMDGMTMVRALRADAMTPRAAILMLTSEASVEAETLALSIGADDYILKPVEPRRLAARVKAVLARAAARPDSPPQ